MFGPVRVADSLSIFCCATLIVLTSANGWTNLAASGPHSKSRRELQLPTDGGDSISIVNPEAPGGLSPLDLSDSDTRNKIYELAQIGLDEINRQPNRRFRQNLIQVQNAYKQAVSGFLYHITFTSGQSTCLITPENLRATRDACPLARDAVLEQCTTQVLEQAWLDVKKAIKAQCA